MQKKTHINQNTLIKKAVIVSTSLIILVSVNSAFAESPLKITVEENFISACEANSVLMQYRFNNIPFKPYVQKLCSPRGINILRDAPADHLHHHGLMFAVAVDGVNFWEEHIQPIGMQRHLSFCNVVVEGSGDLYMGGFTELINWENSQTGKRLLKEQRTIRFSKPKKLGCTLLNWRSVLQVPAEKKSAMLMGKRYFGLGMRFVESMDKDGWFHNADGDTGVKRTNGAISPWCAYSAKANGKLITVAMFGFPYTGTCKSVWFTYDKSFAYLALTMNLNNEQIELNSIMPLILHYGVAVWDGRADFEQIDKAYKWWTNQQIPMVDNK